MNRFGRSARVFTALILAFSCVLSGFFAWAEEEGVVYPIWRSNYSSRDEDMWNPGMNIQCQIQTTVPIRSFTLNYFMITNPEADPADLEFTVKVYKWNTNILKTVEGEPISVQKCKSYLKSEADSDYALTWDSGEAPLEKGEYVFEFNNTSCYTVLLSRFLAAPTGVRCYLEGRSYGGAFPGSVVASEEAKYPFRTVSTNYDLVYNPPPEEPVIGDNDPIAVLGVDSTKWGAVDGLGRTLPSSKETGEKKDKVVGIFYWTWHLNNRSTKNPRNINNILEEYPEAVNDYNHPIWSAGGANFWNEPLFGYYVESDDYVLRKHAELLADAGIDFVLFDCTNGSLTWPDAYMNLLKVWSKAREDGVNTPKVAFMMQFGYSGNTRASLWDVYTNLYKKGLYQDLWFYLDGKPMVMAWETGLDKNIGNEAELLTYFTYRHPIAGYWAENGTDDSWGWLSTYPQTCYYNEDGTVEMTTVGIAQNANYETQSLSAMNSGKNMGRSYAGQENYSYSYTYRGRKIVVDGKIENSKLYGRNFQEQWDYAIEKDPEIVFVTGWNEWIMGRYEEWCGVANAFPDQCNDENSRDIEPSKGDLKDHYYYQLVANVRRFKGASEMDYQPEAKTIDIGGDMSQWNDPSIVTYNHYANNTPARNNIGFGEYVYVSDPIRNDFTQAKVSYNEEKIWFYVRTASDVTPFESGGWMSLLIDSGAASRNSEDWEEFEFIIGREGTDADTMILEKSTGGWNWEKAGEVRYRVEGNEMVVEVPRKLLGAAGKSLDFGFKWCDNNLSSGDILDLYCYGDAAPGGRFVFRFAARPSSLVNGLAIALICIGCAVLCGGAVLAAVMIGRKKKAGAKKAE